MIKLCIPTQKSFLIDSHMLYKNKISHFTYRKIKLLKNNIVTFLMQIVNIL